MGDEAGVVSGSSKRVYRTVAEKRRIVELTLQPGASVAKVAQAEAVNSHQIFDWRRAYQKGKLESKQRKSTALLPVVLSPAETSQATVDASPVVKISAKPATAVPGSSIHIEFPGRTKIRVERGSDPVLLRSILECLQR
jgi:transposase